MHRTQIYFEEELFKAIKKEANSLGVSISAYIREVLKRDLEQRRHILKRPDFSEFAGMWKDREVTQESIRESAWRE